MFDPFQIYRREKKDTHKGQIIRKKPVDQLGPISAGQLPLIEQYAKALGYKLYPITFQPPPQGFPRTYLYREWAGWSDSLIGFPTTITFQHVARIFNGTPIKNLPDPGYVYKIEYFHVRGIITLFYGGHSYEAPMEFLWGSPHLTIVNNYFPGGTSALSSIQNPTQLYVVYLDSSNNSYSTVVHNYESTMSLSGAIDYRDWEYHGAEAETYYNYFKDNASALSEEPFFMFKMADNSTNTARYVKYVAYVEVGIREVQ